MPSSSAASASPGASSSSKSGSCRASKVEISSSVPASMRANGQAAEAFEFQSFVSGQNRKLTEFVGHIQNPPGVGKLLKASGVVGRAVEHLKTLLACRMEAGGKAIAAGFLLWVQAASRAAMRAAMKASTSSSGNAIARPPGTIFTGCGNSFRAMRT
jgi:hypothetical protein